MDSRQLQRWAPALAAAAIIGIVGVAVAASGSGGGGGGGDSAASAQTTAPDATDNEFATDPFVTEAAVSAPDVEIEEPDTTGVPKDQIRRSLVKGMASKDVKKVQQRLIELHFDPGEADGVFGEKTRAAVWAFEKLVLGTKPSEVTGKVTPDMWLTMQEAIVIKPKRTKSTRTHMEIYLPSQVAVLFVDNKARIVTHISSGSGESWEEEVTIDPGEEGNEDGTQPLTELVAGTSITPGGVYKFYRRYVDPATNGWRESRLGRMYQPVYFNQGIAVHGSHNVPNEPASHGCIRIPMHIAEYFPSLVQNGDRVYVFDGVKSPEYYGAKRPPVDRVVNITPTTTTTQAKTTTTKKPTTSKPTTTEPDQTTTTKKKPTTTSSTTTTTAATTTEEPTTSP